MQWITMLMVVGMQVVTAGELKLWFDDGKVDRLGCGSLLLLGEKGVRRFDGGGEVNKMSYEDFYTMMKAYVKMAGDRVSVGIKFDEGMSANKALAVMREMSEIGVKSVVIPREVEEEVIEKAKIDPKVKKTPASPSSTDTPFIVPVPRSSEGFLQNEESEEGNVAPEAVGVKNGVGCGAEC